MTTVSHDYDNDDDKSNIVGYSDQRATTTAAASDSDSDSPPTTTTTRTTTGTTEPIPWYLQKTALIWEQKRSNHDETNQPPLQQQQQQQGYWDNYTITPTIAKITTADDDGNHSCCSLSYFDYLYYIFHVALLLRNSIAESSIVIDGTLNQHRCCCYFSIPIVVAIPEGPWLPLSIAAVHILNEPFTLRTTTSVVVVALDDPKQEEPQESMLPTMCTSGSGSGSGCCCCCHVSIVLVPMDPNNDGQDRLIHMIKEIQPAIIVTACDQDDTKIQQIIDSCTTQQNKNISSHVNRFHAANDPSKTPITEDDSHMKHSGNNMYNMLPSNSFFVGTTSPRVINIAKECRQQHWNHRPPNQHDHYHHDRDSNSNHITEIDNNYGNKNEHIRATLLSALRTISSSTAAGTGATDDSDAAGPSYTAGPSCSMQEEDRYHHESNHHTTATTPIGRNRLHTIWKQFVSCLEKDTNSDHINNIRNPQRNKGYHESDVTTTNTATFVPTTAQQRLHRLTHEPHHHVANRISHIVYTSGTTGIPKGCVSSIHSLDQYLLKKNRCHSIASTSIVLLASSISFDPCLSDILATIEARGTLAICRKYDLIYNLSHVLSTLSITHVLCTPTMWSNVLAPVKPLVYPHLRVVALGGEPIPKSITRQWLLQQQLPNTTTTGNVQSNNLKLYATYGVTEACVYQTIGQQVVDTTIRDEEHEEELTKVVSSSKSLGQDVGYPFPGISIRICTEKNHNNKLIDIPKQENGDPSGLLGEIILSGTQLDSLSSYFRRPSLTSQKFITDENGVVHYRTGDRGYICPHTKHLHIVGRIEGEEGTIKVNGIRVELGEIEASLIDDDDIHDYKVVTSAIAVAVQSNTDGAGSTEIHVYLVLGESCLHEWRLPSNVPDVGILCHDTPLLILLRERCRRKARVVPSAFVIIPHIPMSPTGKRQRQDVPPLKDTISIVSMLEHCFGGKDSIKVSEPLQRYGKTGSLVTRAISECLNLLPCQIDVLSTTTSFAMIGGDSLTATRVVRLLYARAHNVIDNRFIGGEYGSMDGPFSVIHLLRCANLGEYVDWLDSHGICRSFDEEYTGRLIDPSDTISSEKNLFMDDATILYEALLQATSLKLTQIALGLLDVGADPNIHESTGRIGKVSHRNIRKKMFRSNPLHLACLHGDPCLVKKLLDKGAKYNIPNASSLFPMHLAAAGEFHTSRDSATSSHAASFDVVNHEQDDHRRLLCIQYLLLAGCPIHIRDGSKQTIIHAAARGGNVKVLQFVLQQWIKDGDNDSSSCSASNDAKTIQFDYRDNWGRTPVHWAVLNGQIGVLDVLLVSGYFRANPPRLNDRQRRTSVAEESPMEICHRLYHSNPELYQRIQCLLLQHTDTGTVS